jgi:uncharacterized RDD family membrane protein YckC
MTVTPRLEVTGHYAGPATRAAGAVLDIAIVLGLFAAGVAGFDLLARVVVGSSVTTDWTGLVSIAVFAAWAFFYMYVSLAIAGRTPGKGIIGLRVVNADGSPLAARRALLRTLAFPLSALLAGLGFALLLVQREHRALHDLIAGTAVVYDWGGRAAELPGPLSEFLARRAGTEYTSKPT